MMIFGDFALSEYPDYIDKPKVLDPSKPQMDSEPENN